MSLPTTLFLTLIVISQLSNAQYVNGGRQEHYNLVADNNDNDGGQLIHHPQLRYPGMCDTNKFNININIIKYNNIGYSA